MRIPESQYAVYLLPTAMPVFTLGFEAPELADHFDWHGPDFPVTSPSEYEDLADRFLGRPPSVSTVECMRLGGDMVRYDPTTGELGVLAVNRMIRTYFKPIPCHTVPVARRIRPDGRKNCHGLRTNREYFEATCRSW